MIDVITTPLAQLDLQTAYAIAKYSSLFFIAFAVGLVLFIVITGHDIHRRMGHWPRTKVVTFEASLLVFVTGSSTIFLLQAGIPRIPLQPHHVQQLDARCKLLNATSSYSCSIQNPGPGQPYTLTIDTTLEGQPPASSTRTPLVSAMDAVSGWGSVEKSLKNSRQAQQDQARIEQAKAAAAAAIAVPNLSPAPNNSADGGNRN